MGFIKYFYLMLSVLCDLPHSVTTEADVGDPGEAGHSVLLSNVGEPHPEYCTLIGQNLSRYYDLIGRTLVYCSFMP